MRRYVLTALALGLTSVLGGALPHAQACAIDGIPSISADGRIATRNLAVPKRATLETWSPFLFKQPFGSHTVIRLREDPALLVRAMGPDALRARWRWAFGDGHSSGGALRVAHSYSHPGSYRVVVSTYDPAFKTWFPFDSVELTIHS